MLEAIKNRISQRTFLKEAIDSSKVEKLEKIVEDINKDSGLNIEFIEDGSKAFSDIRTTYGLFKNVRSMFLMKGNENMPDFREKVGYYGEKLILEAVTMGLGTCWVGGTFDKGAFTIPEGEYIAAAILVGPYDKPSIKDKVLKTLIQTKKKPLEDRISSDKELPAWILDGMEAVILAPSALNKQKPHFTYENDVLSVDVPNDYAADMVDLGIAKLHFELGAKNGKFEFGNGGEYKLN